MQYTETYESQLIRSDQDELPWHLHQEIAMRLSSEQHLLDVGAGTCFKTIPLAALADHAVGLEPNSSRRAKATANITSARAANLHLVAEPAEQLPPTKRSTCGPDGDTEHV